VRIRLAVALSCVVALSACANVPRTGQANLTPSPSQSASASPSDSVTSPLPSTSPSTSPIVSGFPGCTLPYVRLAGSGSAPFTGGFVSGTHGLWTSDPAGQINQSGDLLVTSAKPTLTGSGFSSSDAISYDAVLKRWLPVRLAQVRFDGLAYTYAEPYKASPGDSLNTATRIHVVSLSDSSDRVIYAGSPRTVLAYQPDGIYIAAIRYYSGDSPASGVWRLNPATGASTQLPNSVGFRLIDHGTAWTDYWVIMPTRLDRIDVATGASQTWANTQGEGWIWFVGLDSKGNPLVDVSQGTNSNWRLFVYTAPQTRTLIAAINVHQEGITDSHGTWLAGDDGIYLLKPGLKLEKVSNVIGGNVAGPCN
jgi:hypothetical protein